MQLTLKISSYNVQPDKISIRMYRENNVSPEVRTELNNLVKKDKNISIGGLSVKANIVSIKLTKTLSITIHIERDQITYQKLYELIDKKEYFDTYVNSGIEDALIHWLDLAAKATGSSKSDVLYEISTFPKSDKSGIVEGKRSIYELSLKRQKVVLDKLKKMLSNTKEGGNSESD